MKTKRLLSLIIAIVLCFTSLTVFAEEVTVAEEATEEIIISTEEGVDDPTEEIVVMTEEDDGSIDYSDMSNWAYWENGVNTEADLFFICPTVDMGKGGNFLADIENGRTLVPMRAIFEAMGCAVYYTEADGKQFFEDEAMFLLD